jgi:hypothetical protein
MTAPGDNSPPHALTVVVTTICCHEDNVRTRLRGENRYEPLADGEDQGQQSESRCTGRSVRCFT